MRVSWPDAHLQGPLRPYESPSARPSFAAFDLCRLSPVSYTHLDVYKRQFYAFPQLDARKISSTNVLERLNREIRRRTCVVGIFPSADAYTRLVTTYLMEYAEDWSASRAYLSEQSVQAMLRPAA